MRKKTEKRIANTGKTVVLLAITDASIRELVRHIFSGNTFHLFEAADGNDVELLFRRLEPDLVIVDSLIKPADALSICQRIRLLSSGEKAAIVVIGTETQIAPNDFLKAGADDFLTYPLFPALLQNRADTILRSKQSALRLSIMETLFTHAGEAMLIVDRSFRNLPIIEVNQAFETLTGYSSADVVGRNEWFFSAFADESVFKGLTENHKQMVAKVYRKDGSSFWGDIKITPVLNSKKPVTHQAVLISDVTPQVEAAEIKNERQHIANLTKEMELAFNTMKERRRFTETILDEITAGIITTNPQGLISFVNRMALSTIEGTSAQSLGKDVLEVFGKNKKLQEALLAAEKSGEQRIDFELTTSSRRKLDIGMTIIAPKDARLPEFGYVLLFRDLSSRHQIEMELRRVERLTALGHMASGFAHEVRNPLAALRSLSEILMAETEPTDPRQEYIRRSLSLLQRIEHLVTTSLHFGKPKLPRLQICNPASLIENTLDILAPRFKDYSTTPVVEMNDDLPSAYVDEGQIVEVLLTLIENALDSVGEPSRIRIAGSSEPVAFNLKKHGAKMIRIDIQDDGTGIAEDLIPYVFDPFFTTKPKGTGLGLSIAQRLVESNHGHLLLSSTPGVETIFSLFLPVWEKEDEICFID
ncbi:MAG: PAS domain-containing protein [Acidobacteriota bacterium]